MKKEKLLIAICLTFISLTGAGVLYAVKAAPILIASFVGLGLATIIYFFLGGMREASLIIAGLRVGGASAIIIFSMSYVSKGLENYIPSPLSNVDKLFKQAPNEWIPIGSDGKPIELTIETIKFEDANNSIKIKNNFLKNNGLAAEVNNDLLQIFSKSDKSFSFGMVPISDIRKLKFFNSILDENRCLYETNPLTAGATNAAFRNEYSGQVLPIKINTTIYAANLSGFRIMNADNHEIAYGQLGTREGKIFRFEDECYLIFVLSANHLSVNQSEITTKFAAYNFSIK